MSDKYRLGEDMRIVGGVTLHRIVALRAGPWGPAGTVGGWIETTRNLNQTGNAWVSGDARLFGDARVSEGVRVSGSAQVYGGAQVYGDAQIASNTDWISCSPIGSRQDTLTAYRTDSGWEITTGCFRGDADAFEAAVRATHANGSPYRTEYLAALALLRVRFASRDQQEAGERVEEEA